jgi:hypothetical protein
VCLKSPLFLGVSVSFFFELVIYRVNRVCFFRFVCVVEFLAALAVRVIDAFNAETLYCGGAVHGLRISYRRCCLRGRRIDPVRSAFVSGISWMASISE